MVAAERGSFESSYCDGESSNQLLGELTCRLVAASIVA
jgi:hypothetical protein